MAGAVPEAAVPAWNAIQKGTSDSRVSIWLAHAIDSRDPDTWDSDNIRLSSRNTLNSTGSTPPNS